MTDRTRRRSTDDLAGGARAAGEALKLDLVGPGPGDALAEELLPGRVPPLQLVPDRLPHPGRHAGRVQTADADEDDDFGETPDDAGLAEESNEEGKAAKKGYFPSSMGLSFLVPGAARRLSVTVRWGDYARDEIEDQEGKAQDVWRRSPREQVVEIALGGGEDPSDQASPGLTTDLSSTASAPCGGDGLDGAYPGGHLLCLGLSCEPTRAVSRKPRHRLRVPARDSRFAASCPSSRVPTCAAPVPTTGTSRLPTCTTRTHPSTRPATASRPTGSSSTRHATWSAPRGSRLPRSRRPPRSASPASSSRWTLIG